MKTTYYILILFFLLGCSKDDLDGWVDSIPEGGSFFMGNRTRYYYINEDNTGQIKPEKNETFPFSYKDGIKPAVIELPDVIYKSNLYDGDKCLIYNDNLNSIDYDEDEKMYYSIIYLQGDNSKHTYTFYVSCDGILDQFDVKYSYKRSGNVLGGVYETRVDELKINGMKVIINNNSQIKKVFIKRQNGKTVRVTSK